MARENVHTALLFHRHFLSIRQLHQHHPECVHELAVRSVEYVFEFGRFMQSNDLLCDICSLDGRPRVFAGQCIADQTLSQLWKTAGSILILLLYAVIFVRVFLWPSSLRRRGCGNVVFVLVRLCDA